MVHVLLVCPLCQRMNFVFILGLLDGIGRGGLSGFVVERARTEGHRGKLRETTTSLLKEVRVLSQ